MTEAEIEKKWENTVWDTDVYLDDIDGQEPLTNEEYFKSCTTEQLAEYLAYNFDLCGAGCHHCFLAKTCLTKAKNGNPLTQEQMIVEWLKQPHTEKE